MYEFISESVESEEGDQRVVTWKVIIQLQMEADSTSRRVATRETPLCR